MRPLLLTVALVTLCAASASPSPPQASPVSPPQTSPPAPASADDLAPVRAQIQRGELDSAEIALRARLRTHDTGTDADADAHFLLGYLLFRKHRPTESLAEYTAGARQRTPPPSDILTVASDYVLLKDYPDADRWFLYVTSQEPGNAAAWYLLGRTQFNEDHPEAAAASFTRCLQLRPRDIRAEYNLGLALEKLQRPADALHAYDQAIAWQTGAPHLDAQPWLDRGVLLLAQARSSDAVASLQRAVTIAPRNALAQQELGRALEAASQPGQALEAYSRAVALAPEAERPHFFLGRLLRKLGRTADADAQFAIVARLSGTHSEAATPNEDAIP